MPEEPEKTESNEWKIPELPEWKKKFRPKQEITFGPLKSNKDRSLAGKARRNMNRRGRRG